MQGINTLHVVLVLAIVGVTTTAAAPSTICSPIIPTDNCGTVMTEQEAKNLLISSITPVLRNISMAVTTMLDNSTVEAVTERLGPYRLDAQDHPCRPDVNSNNARAVYTDCIARSVYRLKCEVPFVTDIVKREYIRFLVLEQSNYAIEFKEILRHLGVLFHLRELISRYRPLNSCNVPESSCPQFSTIGVDRQVVIKSIAVDFEHLSDDLQTAIHDVFFHSS